MQLHRWKSKQNKFPSGILGRDTCYSAHSKCITTKHSFVYRNPATHLKLRSSIHFRIRFLEYFHRKYWPQLHKTAENPIGFANSALPSTQNKIHTDRFLLIVCVKCVF